MTYRLLALGGLYAAALIVCAETADHTLPIAMSADSCTVDQKNKDHQQSICSHSVLITQGTLEARADRATVITNARGEQVYTLEGNPVQFRQKLDGERGWMEGQGQQAVMSTSSNETRLGGGAWIKADNRQINGETLVYNRNTGETRALASESSSDKRGVRLSFAPKPKNSKADVK